MWWATKWWQKKTKAELINVANIEIYTSWSCGYCAMAKRLLKSKNVEFTEISVDGKSDVRATMMKRADGRRTVPQIFIDGTGVGGFDDINALDRKGQLDPMIGVSG